MLITLGILGASLFYGDGVITPAISVLSAVEGLKVATPGIGHLVVPITVAVLVALFALQRFGTGLVGRLFAPVMVIWFTVIAILGIGKIVPHPEVFKALLPSYGVEFFVDHPGVAFIALGSVVLTVTGAEALYADMGQFGRSPDPPRLVLRRLPRPGPQLPGPGARCSCQHPARSATRSTCSRLNGRSCRW